MLVEMRTRMDGMEQRMNEKAETTTEPEVETVEREESVEDSDDSEAEKGADKAPDVSPNSIRKDLRLMAQATERLAKLQAEDAELEGEVAGATGRGRGRKSGSKMVASDIMQQRMTFSRAVYPKEKEGKTEQKTPAAPKQAHAGMRCCAAYQKHSCKMPRDHFPFTHACNFCARVTNMLFRHPEADCLKKQAEETKNAKRRE